MGQLGDTINISAASIPEAYEKLLIAFSEERRKQPEKIVVASAEIADPFNQPRHHREWRDIGGLAEFAYGVIHGTQDHLNLWPCTYHQRLFEYPLPSGGRLNKIEKMIKELSGGSREAKEITLVNQIDSQAKGIFPLYRLDLELKEKDGTEFLDLRTNWTRRDLIRSFGPGVIAFTILQRNIVRELSKRTGRNIGVGAYCDDSEELYVEESQEDEFRRVLERIKIGSLASRTYTLKEVAPFLLNDRPNDSGIETMLQRDFFSMPPAIREKLMREVQNLQEGLERAERGEDDGRYLV